jgi:putative chitinase
MQITPAILEAVAGRPVKNADALCEAMNEFLPKAGIDTPLRVAHCLAQCSHETGGFKWFVEFGGPTYCAKYDFRADLGNNGAGEGYRYRGRGILMLTGRGNYRTYGKRLGLPLEESPDLAAEPKNAVRIACLFWSDKGLNRWADKDDALKITKAINGGTLGLADRLECLRRAKACL